MEGNATLLETTLDPFGGDIAHASEQRSSVALEPTHTSLTSQERSFEAALRRGIIPSFSASPSNSAAPPLASESDHSEDTRWAFGEVVATFAYERLVHWDMSNRFTEGVWLFKSQERLTSFSISSSAA